MQTTPSEKPHQPPEPAAARTCASCGAALPKGTSRARTTCRLCNARTALWTEVAATTNRRRPSPR